MEKAKAFFLICAGILMLAVAMDIGTEQAKADFDPEAGGPIIAFDSSSVLLDNGESWAINNSEWIRDSDHDPPIPISKIAFWQHGNLIATNGDYWHWHMSGFWENLGAPPEGTPTESSNWSQLKSSFGK